MKRIISFILLVVMCLTFTACNTSSQEPEKQQDTPPPSSGNVVKPITPGGDFNVGGDYGG